MQPLPAQNVEKEPSLKKCAFSNPVLKLADSNHVPTWSYLEYPSSAQLINYDPFC